MEHWFCSGLILPVFSECLPLKTCKTTMWLHVTSGLGEGGEPLKLVGHDEQVWDWIPPPYKVEALQVHDEAVQRAHT